MDFEANLTNKAPLGLILPNLNPWAKNRCPFEQSNFGLFSTDPMGVIRLDQLAGHFPGEREFIGKMTQNDIVVLFGPMGEWNKGH